MQARANQSSRLRDTHRSSPIARDPSSLPILVPVSTAQVDEWSGHEDKTAREGKGRQSISLEAAHLEKMKSIRHHSCEFPHNLVEQILDGLIRVARRLLEHHRCHVAPDRVLRLNCVDLASCCRLPNPLGLANLTAGDLAECVEDVWGHDAV